MVSKKRLIDTIKKKQLKEPEKIAKERLKRIEDSINLKEPDRVPLLIFTCGHLYKKYYKLSQVCFDYDTMIKATTTSAREFPVDLFFSAAAAEGFIFATALSDHPDIAPFVRFLTGPMHDVLGDKYTRWPGRELREDLPFQFIGGKFMEAEEYDKLIEDPVSFILNTVIPRVCTNLSDPTTSKYIATLTRLGIAIKDWQNASIKLGFELSKLGQPSIPMTFAYAPLDFIGDFLRYPTGALLDVRRYPDKVKHACEALTKPILNVAFSLKPIGAWLSFIPLHLNEMLPPKLYNEFYWPYLKKIIIEQYNNGIKSFVFFEGDHTPHLDTILELPKGWGIAYFEKADFKKAREKLAGHTCIMGGIPTSLLLSASPEKIDEYVKKLLDDIKPGGGIILAPNIAEVSAATPTKNLIALINAVLKYGKYK